jgi:hypothetical protein
MQYALEDSRLGFMSEIFTGGLCKMWTNISMNHGDTSLLGLDEDWGSKVGLITVGAKVRRGE